MNRILLLPALALATALSACGSGTNAGIVTRPDSYDKLIGWPTTGNRLDVATLVATFPELKGIVVTAPEYIEEYKKLQAQAEREGKSVVQYRIPSGARLRIEVQNESELTRSYYVGPHGFIDYPYVGEIKVRGRTVRELRSSIEGKLAAYLKKPKVLIHVQSSPSGHGSTEGNFATGNATSSGIQVFGAITGSRLGPGGINYTGGETLISVLGFYGLPSSAEWRQIRIIRRSPDEPLTKSRVIICDLWEYFAHADVRQDIPLLPGDVIYVPVKWTVGDQFQKDWDLTLKYLNDMLFLDQFKDAMRTDGAFRD